MLCGAIHGNPSYAASNRNMTERARALQQCLYGAAVVVLLAGLCAAWLIDRAAGDEPDADNAAQIVIIDGKAYAIAPTDSKQYMRDLERFGGKATVLFVELEEWFGGLWHGRSLAVTVAWLSTLVSLGLFLAGGRVAPPGRSGEHDGASDRGP
jgi:hypothetical protein